MTSRPATFQQRDIERALRAAKRADVAVAVTIRLPGGAEMRIETKDDAPQDDRREIIL